MAAIFLSEPITAKLFEIQIWRQTNSQSESWMTTGWFYMEPANILRAQCPKKKLVSIETNYLARPLWWWEGRTH